MSPSINPETIASLRTYVESFTTGKEPILPGAIVHVVNEKNNPIFLHASGGSIPLDQDSLAIVYSLTKLVGAIAFMQLVERGLVALDDASVVENVLPELAAKKVLTGFKEDADGKKEWIKEDRKGEITPKMLMNHTYGGGHTAFSSTLREYLSDQGLLKSNDPYHSVLHSPLLWQPGTHTNYGQGFDWLAVLIERLTKQSLKDYLQENIFDPLGLKGIGYEETYGGDITSRKGSEGKFWPENLKQVDGTFVPVCPPILEKVEREAAYPEGKYHSYPLGVGLVSSVSDYARILTTLLPSNNGVDPITGHRLLSPSSLAQIMSPQLPPHLLNDSRLISTAITQFLPSDLQAENVDPHGSYGLGCAVQGMDRKLEGGRRGRSTGSIYWFGAQNTEYWVDGEKGIAVVLSGNYVPWNDESWVRFVAGFEGRLYEGMQA